MHYGHADVCFLELGCVRNGKAKGELERTHEDDIITVWVPLGCLHSLQTVLSGIDKRVLSLAHIRFEETKVDEIIVYK